MSWRGTQMASHLLPQAAPRQGARHPEPLKGSDFL